MSVASGPGVVFVAHGGVAVDVDELVSSMVDAGRVGCGRVAGVVYGPGRGEGDPVMLGEGDLVVVDRPFCS